MLFSFTLFLFHSLFFKSSTFSSIFVVIFNLLQTQIAHTLAWSRVKFNLGLGRTQRYSGQKVQNPSSAPKVQVERGVVILLLRRTRIGLFEVNQEFQIFVLLERRLMQVLLYPILWGTSYETTLPSILNYLAITNFHMSSFSWNWSHILWLHISNFKIWTVGFEN